MSLNKLYFIEQLAQQLKESEAVAERAQEEAREAARSMATDSEKKEDGRAAIEQGTMATAQGARARKAQEELKALAAFSRQTLPTFNRKTPVALGAIVDIAIDGDDGHKERTFMLLPVGAGTELVGPGGDGFLSVITPASPVGRALLGKRSGDTFEISVRDEVHEWSVVEVS